MSKYSADRAFTDDVHIRLAVPLIYNPIQWWEVNLDQYVSSAIDIEQGIDYIFRYDGALKSVQERFREAKYARYADFTIRYRRDTNKHEDRKASEFYKMKAQFFTYGITNGEKAVPSSSNDFLKYAIIDLEKVYNKLATQEITIKDSGANYCKIIGNNTLECPIKYNADGSSSFFPIDIAAIIKLWGKEMIITQKGFI